MMLTKRAAMLGLAGAAAAGAARAQPVAVDLASRFAATLSAHDMTAFAALIANDYVNHQTSAATRPPPADRSMKQNTVNFFAARLAAMPDLAVTVEAVVANADQVAASFVYTGTHGGVYFGIAPTGRTLRFTSCDIFRVRDGQLAEHWGMGDLAGLLAQLRA